MPTMNKSSDVRENYIEINFTLMLSPPMNNDSQYNHIDDKNRRVKCINSQPVGTMLQTNSKWIWVYFDKSTQREAAARTINYEQSQSELCTKKYTYTKENMHFVLKHTKNRIFEFVLSVKIIVVILIESRRLYSRMHIVKCTYMNTWECMHMHSQTNNHRYFC